MQEICRQLNTTLKDLYAHLLGLSDGEKRLIEYCVPSASGIFDEKLARGLLDGFLRPSIPKGVEMSDGCLKILDEETSQVRKFFVHSFGLMASRDSLPDAQ